MHFQARLFITKFAAAYTLIAVIFFPYNAALAGPGGALDPAFGIGGKTIVPSSRPWNQVYDSAVQVDGKIVLVGAAGPSAEEKFIAVRLNSDGNLDTNFGVDGEIILPTATNSVATAVAIQWDGKIVIAGHDGDGFGYHGQSPNPGVWHIMRLNGDGTYDSSFGNNGIASYDIGALFPHPRFNALPDSVETVNVQPDGKVVLAGGEFLVVRLNPDGTLDEDFGTRGAVRINHSVGFGSAHYLDGWAKTAKITRDGKIVVAGHTEISTLPDLENLTWYYTIARLTASGTPDPGFGTQGVVHHHLTTGGQTINSIAVLGNNKILAGGNAIGVDSHTDFVLLRLNTDGSLDTRQDSDPGSAFGNNGSGYAFIDMYRNGDSIDEIAVQRDGKIIALGIAPTGGKTCGSLLRTSADGAVDNSFDQDGKLPIYFDGRYENCFALALAPDCKIVVAGDSRNLAETEEKIVAARVFSGLEGTGQCKQTGTQTNPLLVDSTIPKAIFKPKCVDPLWDPGEVGSPATKPCGRPLFQLTEAFAPALKPLLSALSKISAESAMSPVLVTEVDKTRH